ncbi:CYTH domain-containing protein [Cupriavidus sp. YR651]|uniref:CYTH domain-containing protein n=1 Tax=Cupriavidus sp. YR651 TaxID=1855315 RepID=UPI00088018DD|nr:CYTH domain-containing protein [Cupriavidus sp. YR651]SDD65867.1 CYTH domain-containing protein [Cupriavidus sp. YR651]
MAREIELKLAVPDAALAAVAAWLDANGQPRGETTLLNVYLDTPDRDLARARAALRLRKKGAQWLQTLKTAGSSAGGLASRHEWETEVVGQALDLARFPDEARKVLAPLAGKLAPVFRTDFVRRIWIVEQDGVCIEAALDTGTITAPGTDKSEHIQELELEWLPGDLPANESPIHAKADGGAKDRANAKTSDQTADSANVRVEAALRAFGRRLAHVAPLTPSDLSKAARGYRLTGGQLL